MNILENNKDNDFSEKKKLLDKLSDNISGLSKKYMFLENIKTLEISVKDEINAIFDFTISTYQDDYDKSFGDVFLENLENSFSTKVDEFICADEQSLLLIWKSLGRKLPFTKRIEVLINSLELLKLEPDIDRFLALINGDKTFSNPNTVGIIQAIQLEGTNFSTLLSSLELSISSTGKTNTYHSFSNLSYDELYDNDDNYVSKNSIQLFFDSIYSYPVLSPDENSRLLKEAKAGNRESRDLFVNSNLRLVVSIAKNYHHPSVSFMDLVQEGTIGLMKAIERYDFEKGFQFSTYATYWIRQAILRYIGTTADLIRKPMEEWEKNNKILKVQNELSIRLQRDPTLEEIADYSKLSLKEVKNSFERMQIITSLNTLVSEDDDAELGDFLDSNNQDIENLENNNLYEYLDFIMKTKLKSREYHILKSLYFEGKTLEQTSLEFSLTHERIRQLRAKAIHLLHSDPRIEEFVQYMDNPLESLIHLYLSRDTKNSTRASLKASYSEEEYIVAKTRAEKKLSQMNSSKHISNLKVRPSATTLNMKLKRYFPNLVKYGFSFDREDVKELMKTFDKIDRIIIQLSLGYRDCEVHTVEEISSIVKLDVDTVIERKNECILKIEKVLKDYINYPKKLVKTKIN